MKKIIILLLFAILFALTASICRGKSDYATALEVIRGDWGNGDVRKNRLIRAGCNYNAIQNLVNQILNS